MTHRNAPPAKVLSESSEPSTIATEGQIQRCPSCGTSFTCGREAPAGCWCARLEPISAEALRWLADVGERCLCARCLARQLARSRSSAADRQEPGTR